MPSEANARQLPLRRRTASCQYDSDGREIACTRRSMRAGSKSAGAKRSTALIVERSLEPHARVDQPVQQIHDDDHEDEECAVEDRRAHDDRVVELLH